MLQEILSQNLSPLTYVSTNIEIQPTYANHKTLHNTAQHSKNTGFYRACARTHNKHNTQHATHTTHTRTRNTDITHAHMHTYTK